MAAGGPGTRHRGRGELGLGRESGGEDGRHLRLLLLDEAAEGEGKAEVREHGGVVEGRGGRRVVQRLELHGVGGLGLGRHHARLLLAAATKR